MPRTVRVAGLPDAAAPPLFYPAEWLAVALPLLGFLVTLPTHKPFAAGQGLGLGFLIGGSGAVILFLMMLRRGLSGASSTGLALATLTVAMPLVLLRPVLLDALMGVAIGWFAITFLITRTRRSGSQEVPIAAAASAAAGFAAALASAAILATLRDPRTPELPKGTWSAIVVAFASALSLLAYIVALVRGNSEAPPTAGTGMKMFPAIALCLALVIGLLLGEKAAGGTRLFSILAVGLLSAPLILWVRSRDSRTGRASDVLVAKRFAGGTKFLAVLIIISGFMVGGQLLLGYGAAVFIVALWAASLMLAPRPSGEDLRLLLFGSVLALYRAYLAAPTADLHGVNLSDQYAVFGFVVGASAPALITSLVDGVRLGKSKSGRPIVESVTAGLFALAAPAITILLFGPKCLLALIIGSAVGGVFTEGLSTAPILLALGMALAINQFDGLVQPYADISRLVKLKVLAVVMACLLATAAVAALKGRDDEAIPDGDGGEA